MVSRNKKKVIEVLLIDDDFNLLKHHLQNVYQLIEHVFIFINEDFERLPELKNITSEWMDKISFFFLEKNSNHLDLTNLIQLSELLKKIDFGFEDIICFSEISEIPDLSDFENVLEHLKFEPVILRMTDFVFNLKNHCKNRHLGSICVNFSFILTHPNKINQLYENKKVFFWRSFYIVDNGYKFSFFQKKQDILSYFQRKKIDIPDESFENIISKNIHPKFFETGQIHYLSDYNEKINFNIHNLEEQDEITSSSNKILIILNMKQKKVDESLFQEYLRIINYNFTADYSLPEYKTLNNVENVNIFIPKTKFYEVDENKFFETEFAIKELIRKLHSSNLTSSQILTFVIYIDEIELSEGVEIHLKNLNEKNIKKLLIEFFESNEHLQDFILLNS